MEIFWEKTEMTILRFFQIDFFTWKNIIIIKKIIPFDAA